jgi:hypothetical protein
MCENTPPTKKLKAGNGGGSDLFQNYYLQFLEEEGIRQADDGDGDGHGGIRRNTCIHTVHTLFSPATNRLD